MSLPSAEEDLALCAIGLMLAWLTINLRGGHLREGEPGADTALDCDSYRSYLLKSLAICGFLRAMEHKELPRSQLEALEHPI